MSYKVLIIKGFRGLENTYIKACKELNVEFDILDPFCDSNWIYKFDFSSYDRILVRPPCDTIENRFFYNDIIDFIDERGGKLYPDLKSLRYYENKRYFYYVCLKRDIKTAQSEVVHTREDLLTISEKIGLPVVVKAIVGSGSSGVVNVESKRKLRNLGRKIFGIHSAFSLGMIPRLSYGLPAFGRAAKHACLVQKKVNFKWEWRVIRIGSHVSCYRKLKGRDGFASGSEIFGFGLPDQSLLNQVRIDINKLHFTSGALDYFELDDGTYLLNEAQALFGAKPKDIEFPDAQMFDSSGDPCFFYFKDGTFDLRYGSQCQNACANLRVQHALGLI